MAAPGSVRGYRFGPFELDLGTGVLRKDGRKRRLPGRAFRALVVLLESRGALVTREELRRRIWPKAVHVEFEHGLNNAVHDIRRALGDRRRLPVRIETVPRRGYRFVGDVETVTDEIPRHNRFLQAMVASLILASALSGFLLISRSRSDTPGSAWSAYVRANYFLAQRTTESVRRSVTYFDEAVESFERSVTLSPDTKKYASASIDALERAGYPAGAERLRAAIERH